MTQSANLGLPYISGAQAQKHFWHDEALRVLDTLVQLAVLDRDLNAPPSTPAEGERWIVKASPAPTGEWAGHGNHVAAWQDGGWQFSAPKLGWVAFVADEGTLVSWNGAAWGDFFETVTALQNLARLGIGTTADATNPFAAKLNNALWTAKTAAEGGDGDLRYKMSKESAGDTLSLLMQTNFSGRAEIGLAGDDDLHVKVSADGSSWLEALVVDRATGRVSFPRGAVGVREALTAARTYYVRPDGSDSNNGLANNAGGAFLTIQKAVDAVAALDLSIFQATIQIADGTYTDPVLLKSTVGALPPIVQGNAVTPANVFLDVTGTAITNDGGGVWIVKDLKIEATAMGMTALNGGTIRFSNLELAACGNYHLWAQPFSSIIATGNYAVSGGAQVHALSNGKVELDGRTVTFSNTPAFSMAFALASLTGVIRALSMTFVNGATVTGGRYTAALNGAIFTSTGGSATYFPGDAAGSTATGGQYA